MKFRESLAFSESKAIIDFIQRYQRQQFLTLFSYFCTRYCLPPKSELNFEIIRHHSQLQRRAFSRAMSA